VDKREGSRVSVIYIQGWAKSASDNDRGDTISPACEQRTKISDGEIVRGVEQGITEKVLEKEANLKKGREFDHLTENHRKTPLRVGFIRAGGFNLGKIDSPLGGGTEIFRVNFEVLLAMANGFSSM